MNLIKRAWRWVTGRVRESDGYPVNPYPPFYRPGDVERRDFFAMILEIDRWQRRHGGQVRERLTDERIVFLARTLEKYNPLARSILTATRSAVLGRHGMQVSVVCKDKNDEAWAAMGTAYLDKVRDRNNWLLREREAYVRARRDGDMMIRLGLDADGEITFRFIETEFCHGDGSIEYDQGVRVDPDDAETPLEYAVEYQPGEWTYIDASEVIHVKLNVDMVLKRGVSDFAATAKILDQAFVDVRNMISSDAYRQANAWVTQHAEGTERAAVENLGGGVATFNGVSDPNGEPVLSQVSEGVSVFHLSNGQQLAGTPGGESINASIAAINQSLQVAVAQYHMPLAQVTGDLSRNNSLDLGSDHPFGMWVQDDQAFFAHYWRLLFWKALEWGVAEGHLPREILKRVDVLVGPQQAVTRDPKSYNEILKMQEDDDIISKKERTERLGYDFDSQQDQIKKERASGIETTEPTIPKSRRPEPPAAPTPAPSTNGNSFHAN